MMHPETREADIEAMLKLAKKYKKSAWKQASEMRDVVWDKGQDAYFCDILWDLQRSGRFDLSGTSDFFWYLTYSEPESYSADDYMDLYVKVCEQPEGALGHSAPRRNWSNFPPGYTDYFFQLLLKRAGDADFFARLAERVDDLPGYARDGFRLLLSTFGAVPAEELPEDTLERVAHLYVCIDGWNDEGRHWTHIDGVWPEEVWGRACVEAALKETRSPHRGAFPLLQRWAEPRELIAIARGYNNQDILPILEEELTWSEPEQLEALIGAARGELGKVEGIQSYYWPSGFLYMTLLEVARRLQRELPADLDALYTELLSNSEPAHFNQEHAPDYGSALIERLSAVIPQKRLEALILASKPPKSRANDDHFAFFTVGTSKKLMKRAIASAKRLSGWASDRQKRQAVDALKHFGEAIIAPLSKAFEEGPTEISMSVLEELGGEAAIPGLVKGLEVKSKALREHAQRALSRYPSAELLPHLEGPMLAARLKDNRLAFATLLATLAWTPEVGALAKKAVEKERTKAVRSVLEPLAERAEASESGEGLDAETEAAAVKTLQDSDGAAWRSLLEELGAATLDVAASWFSGHLRGAGSYSWDELERWGELLEHFKEDSRAFDSALAMFPLFLKRLDPDDYAKLLLRIWPEAAAEALPGVLRKHRFKYRDKIYRHLGKARASAGVFEALAVGLSDSAKGVRADAAEAVALHSDADILPHAKRLLTDKAAKTRLAAARMFEALDDKGAALEVLRGALEGEKSSKVEAALTALIAEAEAEAFSMSRFEPQSEETDAALSAALGKLEALPTKLDPTRLPKVHFTTGVALSKDALAWLAGRVCAEGPEVRDENLWAVRARLRDEDCAALCDALIKTAPDPMKGWPVYARAVIGGARHRDAMGEALDGMARNRSYNYGHDVRAALVRSGSDEAVRWLDHWSRRGRSNTMRGRLPGDLERMASEAGVTLAELLDRALSDFGFDEAGVRTMDYGGERTLTLRLGPENELIIESEGKVVKSPPRARKGEDKEAIKAAKKVISALKKDLKRVNKAQLQRLERACASGRTWEAEAWSERFLRHPIMHAYTRRLIFETLDGAGEGLHFVVTDEGELIDAEVEPVELGEAVRIAHPIDMDEETRAAWAEMMEDMGRSAPFPLLDRRCVSEPPEVILERRAPGEPGRVMNGMKKLGYVDGPREDGGHIYRNTGTFGDVEVTLSHSGFAPESLSWLESVEINGVAITRGGEPVAWESLPARVASEIGADLIRLTEAIE